MSEIVLEPLKFPLSNARLIEASAGTGKTYTIVLLYLRLLLEEKLDVDKILVVTFTNAATEELRGRIRGRLVEAVDCLDGKHKGDDNLEGILARFREDDKLKEGARRRLADALTRMDEAAIFTIHGFRQRMLQENAFESGLPFETELVTDESELRRTVIADFWRLVLARVDGSIAQWLRAHFGSPLKILEQMESTIGLHDLDVQPSSASFDEESTFDELLDVPDLSRFDTPIDCGRLEQTFAAFKTGWEQSRDQVMELFEQQFQGKCDLNRRSYNPKSIAQAVAQADQTAARRFVTVPLPDKLHMFTPETLKKRTLKGHTPPHHAFFDACEALVEYSEVLSDYSRYLRIRILAAARVYLLKESARRKTAKQILFFDDLLRILSQALEDDPGKNLATAIRAHYPVALIDEFQDTDPLQYSIFQKIYLDPPSGTLILIGDPKQAIYSFRGADIFAYIRAREMTKAIHTMGTNYRSASGFVEAVNLLFKAAHRPFIYDQAIKFHSVASGSKADDDPLMMDGREAVPLRIRFFPGEGLEQTKSGWISAPACRKAVATDFAGEIARLLNLSQEGKATLGDRPLAAGDLAVLVRSHNEGRLIQQALRDRGVASVSLHRDSVFLTGEAEELQWLLLAVAAPGNENRMRLALATELLGKTAEEILQLDHQPTAWDRVHERFLSYRDLWLNRGFLVAFLSLLKEEGIPERLRRYPEGERRLTNLLHLVELLQVASHQHPGIERLLRWLADQQTAAENNEEQQLRLESDEALVKIVTIHKSKGLEYPVVFLPFPWTAGRPGKDPVIFHDLEHESRLCLDLGSDSLEEHKRMAATEDLAERMRLLYVAITRAKYMCVTSWGRVNQAGQSAMAWLLHPDAKSNSFESYMNKMNEDEILQALQNLESGSGGRIAVETACDWTGGKTLAKTTSADGLEARSFTGTIERNWRLTSYSNLVAGADVERPDYDPAPASTDLEPASETEDPAFLFPKGPVAGTCLHGLFEEIEFDRTSVDSLTSMVERQLDRYGLPREALPHAIQIVTDVLDTALDADELTLRHIRSEDRLNEVEFHYPLADLAPDKLGAVVRGLTSYKSAADRLQFDPVRGIMRGFIDLVFRHHDRYYIVDYKSNYLGNRVDDYGAEGLQDAMTFHHYNLQYLIYTVALHRYLQKRLPGYAYDVHFGGVYYLFLRGMRPSRGRASGVYFDRPDLVVIEALDRLFSGREKEAA